MFILCCRISSKRTEQLGEAEQVKQNILDVRCLQVSLKEPLYGNCTINIITVKGSEGSDTQPD